MEWGHWIIHPVTLWLHNTELLFTCISSKTEFTHFDHAHISLHVCVMLCHHHHRISSQPLFQCLCFIFAWFSGPILSTCYSLGLVFSLCSVSRTPVSKLTPPAVWRILVIDAVLPLLQKWQAAAGWEHGVWKLVRGISTSHYLVASMHPTHQSLEELQSTTHQEYKPQSRRCGFNCVSCGATATNTINLK